MKQLIEEVLEKLSQPGSREDLENSIQDVIQYHNQNPDSSQKSIDPNIALLKERLAEQKLLSRKSEAKANNLVNINNQKNETLIENYKKKMDQENQTLLRKVDSYEEKNKRLSENLSNLPALKDELATIQGLLSSEKSVQEKLLDEKDRVEKELEKVKTKLKSKLPDDDNSKAINESIKQIKNYKNENLNLKKKLEEITKKDKKLSNDREGLEKEVVGFQNQIKDLQEKLTAVEIEKDELNKHKDELLALQEEKGILPEVEDGAEDVRETQEFDTELNILDEQSKNFKIINQLNDESFELFKTALSSTQSFDERISKLDIFIKKTKEHIETIAKENNDANSKENYSTDILDYFSAQIDKKEAIKGILIKEKELSRVSNEEDGGSTVIIQRKVNKKHAAHGGSWKVAYADFVTAMMAFFLMLWLLSMLSQESRDNLKEYFKSYKAFKHTGKQDIKSSDSIKQADSNSLNDVRMVEEIKKRFQGADEHLKVENVPGGIRIQVMDLMEKPMFETGSARFTKTALSLMEFVAMRIKDLPGNIILEGHTDGTQYQDSIKSNWELSMERASAARIELVNHGMIASRVRRVIAYGGTEPLVPDDYFNPSNRRISIIIMTDEIADVYKKKISAENIAKH
jgi:chemotaxis protein MotB